MFSGGLRVRCNCHCFLRFVLLCTKYRCALDSTSWVTMETERQHLTLPRWGFDFLTPEAHMIGAADASLPGDTLMNSLNNFALVCLGQRTLSLPSNPETSGKRCVSFPFRFCRSCAALTLGKGVSGPPVWPLESCRFSTHSRQSIALGTESCPFSTHTTQLITLAMRGSVLPGALKASFCHRC